MMTNNIPGLNNAQIYPIVSNDQKIKVLLKRKPTPLGETLVEDGAADLSVSLDRIPKSDAAELVHCIAQKLPGEKEQGIFKKRMLEEIKNYGL